MNLMTGVVAKIHRATETSGSIQNGRGSIRTHHAATFLLDGQPVLLRTGSPIFIDEGDCVSVAVEGKGGSLQSFCYHNHSSGVVGAAAHGPILFGAAMMLLVGLLTVWLYIGFGFLAVGALLLHRGWQLRTATQRVRDTRPGMSAHSAAC